MSESENVELQKGNSIIVIRAADVKTLLKAGWSLVKPPESEWVVTNDVGEMPSDVSALSKENIKTGDEL
jgi:hypothetical protein